MSIRTRDDRIVVNTSVYAALAYYFDHHEKIEEELRKEDEWAANVKAEIPSKIPPELRKKFGG